jgi:polar amino acid transport system substrate-binding protein
MLKINTEVKFVLTRLIILALISMSSSLYATDEIKVSTYTNYPPYLHHEGSQQGGLYMGIIDLTLKAVNQPYSVETVPFKRGLYQAATGESILVGILKTDERMKTLDFSEPFYQERVSVFFNRPQVPLIKTVDQLDGLNIGTLLGWSYGAEFDRARAEKRFFAKDGDLESNFYKLAKGRLDAVIHSELSATYALKNLGLKGDIFLASEPLEFGDIHIAVKKGTQKELLERINRKLTEPKHKRAIQVLIETYKKSFAPSH